MAKLSLQLKLGQQLTMTPQLQQAIRLLQMPVLELNTQLQEALENNLMLEQEDPPDDAESATGTEEPLVAQGNELDDSDWADIYGAGRRAEQWTGPDQGQMELPDTSGESLHDHLLWQLEMEDFRPREAAIGHAIVDAINEDGYLTETVEGILATLPQNAGFSMDEVESVLYRVQSLDPAGIGGRTAAECIAIQLRQLSPAVPARDTAMRVAKEGLELLAEGQLGTLRRKLGVAENELDIAIALIRSCHPKPGLTFHPGTSDYIVPDVFVRKQNQTWVVDVNRGASPTLRVNQTYANLLRGNSGHSTLRTQLQEARWLVRSLEIRNETLLRVAMAIVERQIEFLEQGAESMRPLILKDIAEAIEMHESTISRVTTNKYMHTPRGVFEFRYFFSSQLRAEDGSEQSSTAIRARIKRLIGQENPAKPLSDNKIVQLLDEEGIKVARRTVAKYREAMNIAPTSERRLRPERR